MFVNFSGTHADCVRPFFKSTSPFDVFGKWNELKMKVFFHLELPSWKEAFSRYTFFSLFLRHFLWFCSIIRVLLCRVLYATGDSMIDLDAKLMAETQYFPAMADRSVNNLAFAVNERKIMTNEWENVMLDFDSIRCTSSLKTSSSSCRLFDANYAFNMLKKVNHEKFRLFSF